MEFGRNGAGIACILALTWAMDARGQIATNEKAELPFWPCGADLPASALAEDILGAVADGFTRSYVNPAPKYTFRFDSVRSPFRKSVR